MKKYSRLAVALALAYCLAQAGQAFAGTQTFYDDTLVFPNYTGTNTVDTIVGPNINSITVNWDDNGYLTSIVINSSSRYYQWDSLFINTGDGGSSLSTNWAAAEQWDYLVHTNGDPMPNSSGIQPGATVPGQGLYAVSDNYDYTYASTSRIDHVNGIDAADLTMLEDGFHGVTTALPGVYALVYDFSSVGTQILLTDNFVIGYTPYCANDVILAYGDGLNVGGPDGKTPAVPESATMILFGFGIAGLASWQSRRMKK